MIRFYISPVVSAPLPVEGRVVNEWYPKGRDYLDTRNYGMMDGRVDDAAPGWCLFYCDPSPDEHTALIGDPDIRYAPFEDAAGNVIGLDRPLSEVDSAKLQAIRTFLESRHIPVQGLTLQSTVRDAIRTIIKRFKLRQYLRNLDYTEVLDTTVGQIPANRRNAIRTHLESFGFDLSAATLQWTIRQLLHHLMWQDAPAIKTHLD